MLIVHVFVQVVPGGAEAFVAATTENATHSIQEPGIVRFDLIRSVDDPAAFVLVEVYRDQQAALDHKQTSHYLTWREEVAPLMAAPRSAVTYEPVHPSESDYR